MFCKRLKTQFMGFSKTKKGEPNLINKLYKHRTLSELIAQAKQTGIPPMPTRNGVYTGEQPIPRERFERENELFRRRQELAELEKQHSELLDAEAKQAEERKSAELREQIRAELAKEQSAK